MVQKKLKPINEIMTNGVSLTNDHINTSIDPTTNSTSDLNSSIESFGKRKRNQVLHASLTKKKKNI